MPFYIEMPQDRFGNRLYTNSIPQIIEGEVTQGGISVCVPENFPWPTLSLNGWLEVSGPARLLAWNEREQIIAAHVPDYETRLRHKE